MVLGIECGLNILDKSPATELYLPLLTQKSVKE